MLILLGFSVLGCFGAGGFFGFQLLSLHLREDRALRVRKLDIEERQVAVLEEKGRSPAVPKGIPGDLYRRITKWDAPDAQESERKVLLDLYQEFRDAPDPWLEVRAHLPAEPRDDLPQEIFTGVLQS